jgi:hypothetical protein
MRTPAINTSQLPQLNGRERGRERVELFSLTRPPSLKVSERLWEKQIVCTCSCTRLRQEHLLRHVTYFSPLVGPGRADWYLIGRVPSGRDEPAIYGTVLDTGKQGCTHRSGASNRQANASLEPLANEIPS